MSTAPGDSVGGRRLVIIPSELVDQSESPFERKRRSRRDRDADTTRDLGAPMLDVSGVRPLDAHVARLCPVRVQHRFAPPGVPPRAVPELEPILARGRRFEAKTNSEFVRTVTVVEFAGDVGGTRRAMEAGAPVVIGGTLPADRSGRRVGRPDWLVLAAEPTPDGRAGYWPVDIKSHKTMADVGAGTASRFPALVSPFTRPFLADAEELAGQAETSDTTRRSDLLQLAHYWRMLQACGHAPATEGPVWGGVIGTEGVVIWTDLAAPRFLGTQWLPDDRRPRRYLSALELYDVEFAFRLDIAATAVAHTVDPSVELLVRPTKIKECDGCQWWPACKETLVAGSGDVSLIPGLAHRDARKLRNAGVRTRGDLADLSPAEAGELADECGVTRLGQHVDAAWVGVHGETSVYRKRDLNDTSSPRADIEIDLDVEHDNTPTTYLWGTFLTNRSGRAFRHPDGYRPFADWQPANGESERHLFVRLWGWLRDVFDAADALGLSAAVYSWSSTEKTKLLAPAVDQRADVLALVEDPTRWIDLRAHVKRVAVTAHGTSLKRIARAAGFEWRDPGGSGLASIGWFEAAARGDANSRVRLLCYNEDDVRATLAVREWLDDNLPAIDG